MERSRLRPAVALALVVVAVAAAAGAVRESGGGGSPGVGTGEGGGVGLGSGDGVLPPLPAPEQYPVDGTLLGYFLGAALVLGVAVAVYRVLLSGRTVDWARLRALARKAVAGLAVAAAVLVAGVLAVRGLEALFDLASGGGEGLFPGDATGDGGPGTGDGWLGAPVDPRIALLALGLAVGVVLALSRGDDEGEGGRGARAPAPAGADAVVPDATREAAAARTADDVPASNGVYRAWLALAEAADVAPDERSPAEVARRASAAGVDDRTVEELTDLFVEVRYGTAAPTAERERRAERAAARIAVERPATDGGDLGADDDRDDAPDADARRSGDPTDGRTDQGDRPGSGGGAP